MGYALLNCPRMAIERHGLLSNVAVVEESSSALRPASANGVEALVELRAGDPGWTFPGSRFMTIYYSV
jgi:hypothetical protein